MRRLVLLLGAFAALAFAAPALADTQKLDVLGIDTTPRAVSPTLIEMTVPTTAATTAKVAVYIPTGYSLDLSGSSGQIGPGAIALNAKDAGGTNVQGSGTVDADDPAKYVSDSSAQACAPGQHAAVWVLAATVNGQAVRIPFFVDPTTGADVALGAYVIQACFASPDVPAALGGAPLGGKLVGFDLLILQKLRNPGAGAPVWRAVVTPYTAGTAMQNTVGAVEVRCKTPIPFAIIGTKVTYTKKTVTITGRLVSGTGSAAGVPVHIDTGTKPQLASLKTWASAKTNAKGVFTIKHKLPVRPYAFIYVNPTSGACDASLTSAAPGGCVLQTSAIEFGPSLVLKPKK